MSERIRYLLVCLVACVVGLLPLHVQAAKPTGPLAVAIVPSNDPLPGQFLRFKVVVTSQIEAQECEVRVNLPAGMNLESGTSRWQGAIQRGAPLELWFEGVLGTQPAQRIIVQANIAERGMRRFGARAVLVIGELDAANSKPAAPRSRFGQPLIEVPVR